MAKLTLEELTEIALARDADQLELVEDFPQRCGLDKRLNPHIKGDTEMLTVAELSIEDSGYAPLLWAIALEYLKELREATDAATALQAQLDAARAEGREAGE